MTRHSAPGTTASGSAGPDAASGPTGPTGDDDGATTGRPGPPRKWLIGAVTLVAVLLGGYFVFGGGDDGTASGTASEVEYDEMPAPLPQPGQPGAAPGQPPAPASDAPTVTIRYEVTGSDPAAAAISYLGENYIGAQERAVELPWSVEFPLQRLRDTPMSLVAVGGRATGEISCRILVDGEEVASNAVPDGTSPALCTEPG